VIASPGTHTVHTAILQRIRLLIPADKAVCRGFEDGDLTAPSLSISDMQLARAVSALSQIQCISGTTRAIHHQIQG
jgi:hypothetical protein